MRAKAFNTINEPAVFGYIFSIMKPFFREKLLKRVSHGDGSQKVMEWTSQPSGNVRIWNWFWL